MISDQKREEEQKRTNLMTTNVQKLCEEFWRARDAGTLSADVRMLAQQLYVAAAADVVECAGYDPGDDRRVEWAQEVIRQRRMGVVARLCRGRVALEDSAAFLLFERIRVPSGKDLAAGF